MGTLIKARIHASIRRNFILAGFASIFLTTILSGTGQLQAQEPAVVLLNPQSLLLGQGQTGSVVLRIEGASNVYGVQVDLTFDSNQIRILDADETKPGVQIRAGDFLTLENGFEAANEVNNEAGQITYAYSRLSPAESASGSGILFEFEVEALKSGSADLLLNSVIIASSEGDELPIRVADATQEVGHVILPTLTATLPAQVTAVSATDTPISSTPTAAFSSTQPPSAEQPLEDSPEAASPVREISASPTETETTVAAPAVTAESMAITVGTLPAKEEREPVGSDTRTTETTKADPPAAEIAAVSATIAQENSLPAAEQITPALTIIGQNLSADENQEQPDSPAPMANNEGTIEGIYLALRLTALLMALISIWFLRRFQNR